MKTLKLIAMLGIIGAFYVMPFFVFADPPKPLRVPERRQLPDFTINDVWVERNWTRTITDLIAGAKYDFVCTFSNAGESSKAAWKVGHFIDGKLIASKQIRKFPTNSNITVSLPYSPDGKAAGTHTYECMLDYEKATSDKDKSNNSKTIQFRVMKSSSQASCKSDRECQTGNCVDGVCCDQKCEGNCRYCAFPGQEGTCLPVPDGQDPRRSCQVAVGGHPACGGACFAGQCAFADIGTSCGICSACDGNGRCTATPPDDARCGIIDCDGLNTTDREYNDLTSNRCAALGTCKSPNNPADCRWYTDLNAR